MHRIFFSSPQVSKFTTDGIQDCSWLNSCSPPDTFLLFLYSPGSLNYLEFQNLSPVSWYIDIGPQAKLLSMLVSALETEALEPPFSEAGPGQSVPTQTGDVKEKPRGEKDGSSQLGEVIESFRTTVFSPLSRDNASVMARVE